MSAHEANVNGTENGVVLKTNADAPKPVHTHRQNASEANMDAGKTRRGGNTPPLIVRHPIPQALTSFQDTSHAYECGYLDGLVKGLQATHHLCACTVSACRADGPDHGDRAATEEASACSAWLHPGGHYVHQHDCSEAALNGLARDPVPAASVVRAKPPRTAVPLR